jgi:hypothetical protein
MSPSRKGLGGRRRLTTEAVALKGQAMKRLPSIVAASLAAIALAFVLAASGSAQQPGEQTIKLVERPGSERFVDNPPLGTRRSRRISAGDFSVETAPIFDESNTTRLGTSHALCVATRGGTLARVTFQCSGTFVLGQGTLALNFGGKPGNEITGAITGGTGAFEGRTGSAVSRERPSSGLADAVIHLVP